MHRKQFNKTITHRFKRFANKAYSTFNSLQKIITIGFLTGTTLVSAHASSIKPSEKSQIEVKKDSIAQQDLEELIVTASKDDLPLYQASKIVTIISKTDIERSSIQSIQDLLKHAAGIDVIQRGPHGVQSDISLRGSSFDQVAILLNGINLSNPQTGHYSFDLPINLSDIERVEIVQGPSSLTYGASAFAGGINIITKTDNKTNGYATVQGGMHNTWKVETRGAYKSKKSLHQLSAGYAKSKGYIENSDYEILNLLFQNQFSLNENSIRLQTGVNKKQYGANTFYSAQYPNQYDDTKSIFASLIGETNGKLKIKPQIYWSRHYDCFQLIRKGTPEIPNWYTNHNYHRTDVFGTNLTFQYASEAGITSFGSEIRNESIMSNVLGTPMKNKINNYTMSDSRTAINYFVEQNFLFNKTTLSIGALLNHNTANINKYTFYPSINSSYRINKNISLYGSWNRATRMPTFTELYYTTDTHIGNVDLHAEQSEAFETGIKLSSSLFQGNMSAFYMKGSNLIDWVKQHEEDLWESRNHTRINKRGLEANLQINLKQLDKNILIDKVQVGYVHLSQNIDRDDLISNYTLNYLRHKFTASMNHSLTEGLSMRWNFRWQSRTGSFLKYIPDKPVEVSKYKPYSLLDLKLQYKRNKTTLYLSINNVYNTYYYDIGNIPQPGTWGMMGIEWRM